MKGVALLRNSPNGKGSAVVVGLVTRVAANNTFPSNGPLRRPREIVCRYSRSKITSAVGPQLRRRKTSYDRITFVGRRIGDKLALSSRHVQSIVITFQPELIMVSPVRTCLTDSSSLRVSKGTEQLVRRLKV